MSDSPNKDDIVKEDSKNEAISAKREKLERYEATIRRRVECEKRAFHIVNKLIYDCVEPQYLIECGKFLSTDNYGDIVEERAISKLCGYPLCDREIANVCNQKYHISTKSNKVYDITERKSFCSNQCLKASKAFQLQIPESPVWARENEPPAEITLLPHTCVKGIIGKEIVGEPPWRFLEDEIKNLKELDSKSASGIEKKTEKGDEAKVYKHKTNTFKKVSQKEKVSSTNEQCGFSEDSTSNVVSDFDNLSIRDKDEETESLQDSPPCLHKVQLGSSKIGKNDIVDAFDVNGDKTLFKEDLVESSDKKTASPLERLNALLARKKNMLSSMVDIQEAASTNVSSRKVFNSLQSEIYQDPHATSSNNLDQPLLCDSLEIISESEKLEGHPKDSYSSSKNIEGNNSDEHRLQMRRNETTHDHQSPLDRICKVLQPWVTTNTKQYLNEPALRSRTDRNNIGFSDLRVQTGYMDLCKHLDLQEQGITHGLDEITDQKANYNASAYRQSLPDYKYLKEESEGFQIKVTEFITGKGIKYQQSTEDKDDIDPVYLPTVDIYDQRTIRAKIVLDRLDKTFPDLLGPMGLTMQDISSDLRDLIYSFRLERDNIVFKPSEWTLVALILLKILAFRVDVVNSALKSEKALSYLDILLKGIGNDHHNLQQVVDNLLQENHCQDLN